MESEQNAGGAERQVEATVGPRSLDQDSDQIKRLGWALWVSDAIYMAYASDKLGFRPGFRLRCRAKAAVMYDRVLCRRLFPVVDDVTPNARLSGRQQP